MKKTFSLIAFAVAATFAAPAGAQQPTAPAGVKTYKFQSTWPASLTLQDNFKMFAERVDKLTGGQGKIEALAAGQIVRPIKSLADFKGMKCRQTGIVAEIYQRMGMQTVNMPGGEIVPSAQRGVIDCAEWVGGVEDLRLGLPQVWKYHYTPGMHENNSFLELIMNGDVWKGLTPQQQEAVRSAVFDTFVRWGIRWQKQNTDAIEEMRTKYGTQLLRTPPEILVEFLKTSDTIAAAQSPKNPFFKKVYDSQREYAAKVVPAKRFMFPPYSFAANYYFPEKKPAAKAKAQ